MGVALEQGCKKYLVFKIVLQLITEKTVSLLQTSKNQEESFVRSFDEHCVQMQRTNQHIIIHIKVQMRQKQSTFYFQDIFHLGAKVVKPIRYYMAISIFSVVYNTNQTVFVSICAKNCSKALQKSFFRGKWVAINHQKCAAFAVLKKGRFFFSFVTNECNKKEGKRNTFKS